VNATNKKFLKDNFNINADEYSKEGLKQVLDIINKNILLKTKCLIDKDKEIQQRIDYYKMFLENN
jgi:hypothetical protein